MDAIKTTALPKQGVTPSATKVPSGASAKADRVLPSGPRNVATDHQIETSSSTTLQQTEQKRQVVKKEEKIKKPQPKIREFAAIEMALIGVVVAGVDLAQIVLNLLVLIGVLINRPLTILVAIYLFSHLFFTGRWSIKILVILLITFALEFIPIIDSIPWWSLFAAYMIHQINSGKINRLTVGKAVKLTVEAAATVGAAVATGGSSLVVEGAAAGAAAGAGAAAAGGVAAAEGAAATAAAGAAARTAGTAAARGAASAGARAGLQTAEREAAQVAEKTVAQRAKDYAARKARDIGRQKMEEYAERTGDWVDRRLNRQDTEEENITPAGDQPEFRWGRTYRNLEQLYPDETETMLRKRTQEIRLRMKRQRPNYTNEENAGGIDTGDKDTYNSAQ